MWHSVGLLVFKLLSPVLTPLRGTLQLQHMYMKPSVKLFPCMVCMRLIDAQGALPVAVVHPAPPGRLRCQLKAVQVINPGFDAPAQVLNGSEAFQVELDEEQLEAEPLMPHWVFCLRSSRSLSSSTYCEVRRYMLMLAGQDTGSPKHGRGMGVGYTSPLTCMVATPCYRAPEVRSLTSKVGVHHYAVLSKPPVRSPP